MYVTIGEDTYTKITGLSFAPETDLTGGTLPINELQVDIFTTDDISIGEYVELYDDLENLWAKYWIAYAEHIDAQTVRVRAQSALALLERQKMDAIMLDNDSVTDVLQDIFTALGGNAWAMDSSFNNETLTGFCPEQTARERLQWVCFVLGAYVRTFFTDKIEILPIDDTETLVPIDRTFWKPSVTYRDYVTAITAKVYSFATGTPTTTDKWVKDGQGVVYIQTESTVTLTNNAAPAAAPENVITVDNATLLNANNVSGVLSHLAQYYFKRAELDMDIIDNADVEPGDRIIAYADEDTLLTGFVQSATFSFGVQARAKLRLLGVDTKAGAKLVILYLWEETQIGKAEFTFPVGYSYAIQNPYIDSSMNGHRYIFRPERAQCTGTVAQGGSTVEEPCHVALDLYEGVLHVISVDGVTVDSSGDYAIGVIA